MREVLTGYEALAPHYDAFTRDHDHAAWTATIEALVAAHGGRRTPGAVLDVACGTGNSFLPLLTRGWAVTACDLSPAMAAIAAAKAGPAAAVHVADMRELPRWGAFDLVTCLADALNYLGTTADLEAALRSVARNLAPDGVLVFDLNTLRTYRTTFASTVTVERDGLAMTWRGATDPAIGPGGSAEAVVEVAGHPASGHRQRHFPRAAVLAALAAAGLTAVAVLGLTPDGGTDPDLDEERHHKALYLARHALPLPSPEAP